MSLTTHVLDTVRGQGAAGMSVAVQHEGVVIATAILDEAGRATLLQEPAAGAYEFLFQAGAYLGRTEFYDVIPVRFIIKNASQNYHIPLILSAFGYSTYRGG